MSKWIVVECIVKKHEAGGLAFVRFESPSGVAFEVRDIRTKGVMNDADDLRWFRDIEDGDKVTVSYSLEDHRQMKVEKP